MPTPFETDNPPKLYTITHPLQLQIALLSLSFYHSVHSLNPALLFALLINNGCSSRISLPQLSTPGSHLQIRLWELLTTLYSTLQQLSPPLTSEIAAINALKLKIQAPDTIAKHSFILNIYEQSLLNQALDSFCRFGLPQFKTSLLEPLLYSATWSKLPTPQFCNMRDTAEHLIAPLCAFFGYDSSSSAGIGNPTVPLASQYSYELSTLWTHRPRANSTSLRYTQFPLPPSPTTLPTP